MEKLPFFTTVSYPIENKTFGNSCFELFENYFYLGGRSAVVLQGSFDKNGSQAVKLQETNESTCLRVIKSAIKVLSYFTIILPLIALIVKGILRATHKFHIDQTSLEPSAHKPIFSRPPNPGNQTNPISEGEIITGSMEKEGITYISEKVERINTLEVAKKIVEAEKKHLLTLPEKNAEKLSRCDNMLTACRKHPKTWIDSNYFRDHLKAAKSMNSKNKEEALTAYKEAVASYISAPVNYRLHNMTAGQNSYSVLRTGVMTDLTNGYTDLQELEEILQSESSKSTGKQPKNRNVMTLDEKKKELNKVIKNHKNKPRIIATATFALEQIADIDTLKKTIELRKEILQRQMLQLVLTNTERALKESGKISDGNLWIAHLALLNRKTDSIDETGWVHNEEHEIKDMAAIFKNFDGKKIILDGEGPYIDIEGNVHLPILPDLERGDPAIIHLNTLFFNTTVQGHEKNDGIQKDINDEGMRKLKRYFKGQLPESYEKKIINRLNKESTYRLAEDMLYELMDTKIQCSVGCLSAKDRTGFVCARLAYRLAKKHFDDTAKSAQKECHIAKKKQILDQFKLHPLSKSNPAAKVVYDNTGIHLLKVTPLQLPGLKNSPARLKYYKKQAKELLAPHQNQAIIVTS